MFFGERSEFTMNKQTFRFAFLRSLPVLAGYLVLGMGFGMLLQKSGYSFLWALLMSATIYAGAMQYVSVNLLAGGAGLIAAALMTLMVNARHIFYGVSMIEKYRGMGWRKPYSIFGLTDETYSVICGTMELPDKVNEKNFIFLLTLLHQLYWICGSLLGELLGSAVDFNSAGIEFSMTALFVIIFVEQWESTKQHLPALLGLGITALCLLLFGSSGFLLPAMAGIFVAMLLLRGRLEKKGGEELW